MVFPLLLVELFVYAKEELTFAGHGDVLCGGGMSEGLMDGNQRVVLYLSTTEKKEKKENQTPNTERLLKYT